MSGYPEHEKMAAIQPLSQAIGEFLDWAEDHHRVALRDSHGRTVAPFIKLIAQHFSIDADVINNEKRAMLAELHDQQDLHTTATDTSGKRGNQHEHQSENTNQRREQ